jgi:hypothetical protein
LNAHFYPLQLVPDQTPIWNTADASSLLPASLILLDTNELLLIQVLQLLTSVLNKPSVKLHFLYLISRTLQNIHIVTHVLLFQNKIIFLLLGVEYVKWSKYLNKNKILIIL